jgi:hypothetical protein
MPSQFAKVAKERRNELVQELEGLRRELTELSTRLAIREGQLKNLDELLALEDGPTKEAGDHPVPVATPNSPAAPNGTSGAPFLAFAADVLNSKGSPIHYKAMAEILSTKGVYVPGRDPAANLLSHMSRDSRFRRFARGTYGLQHWDSAVAKVGRSRTRRRRTRRVKGEAQG